MVLDKNNLQAITQYLQLNGLIKAHESVLAAEKPGEGNMNYVLRLSLPSRTLIIKQARPYVEKYPSVPAPLERVIIEGAFYQEVANDVELSELMPALIALDKKNHILILEDLGEASDFTFLYQEGKQLTLEESNVLVGFLSVLHKKNNPRIHDDLMKNKKLRALNHEHIFIYPLMEDNGFNLDSIQPGLQLLSMKFKTDALLKAKAFKLGKIYLQDGDALLHGDYYPGSWLKTSKRVMVIDPEFCFYGFPEFDLGVMRAHLMMAQQSEEVFNRINSVYQKSEKFNDRLLNEFTGIEIIRRIIGLAQLPLKLSLPEKKILLNKAYKLIIQ